MSAEEAAKCQLRLYLPQRAGAWGPSRHLLLCGFGMLPLLVLLPGCCFVCILPITHMLLRLLFSSVAAAMGCRAPITDQCAGAVDAPGHNILAAPKGSSLHAGEQALRSSLP